MCVSSFQTKNSKVSREQGLDIVGGGAAGRQQNTSNLFFSSFFVSLCTLGLLAARTSCEVGGPLDLSNAAQLVGSLAKKIQYVCRFFFCFAPQAKVCLMQACASSTGG